MFTSIINNLPQFSKNLKERICVNSDGVDDSLFMTMVTLLYSRVKDLKLSYQCYYKAQTDYNFSTDPETYAIYWIETDKDSPEECLGNYKNSFKSIEKLPVHEKFLSEQLKQKIFFRYMPNENTACVFANNLTSNVWHACQFILSKLFTVFKEKPLTNEEKSFLETLTYKTSNAYVDRLAELVNKPEFNKFLLSKSIIEFEKKLFEVKVKAAELSLSSLEREMNEAIEVYRRACEKRIEAVALVNGLKAMQDDVAECTELQDYLVNNSRLANVTIRDSKISFVVKTYLAPHHVDDWEIISAHINAFEQHATKTGVFSDTRNVKILLDAIFSENRSLRLKMCAYFDMDYFGSGVNSYMRYNYDSVGLKDYMPNPHLNYFNCFGQNKVAILDQLRLGDAIGAIECCIACAQRINIFEGGTFGPFVRDLLSATKKKCLVAEDGTEMTPEEAIVYLKGKEK